MENLHSKDRTGHSQCISNRSSVTRAERWNYWSFPSLSPLPAVSPPLCQVRLSANPKRLLQREVQSLNIILVVVSVCLEQPSPANTILLDKLHNTITTTPPLHYLYLTTLTSHTLIDNSHAVHSQHLNWFQYKKSPIFLSVHNTQHLL